MGAGAPPVLTRWVEEHHGAFETERALKTVGYGLGFVVALLRRRLAAGAPDGAGVEAMAAVGDPLVH